MPHSFIRVAALIAAAAAVPTMANAQSAQLNQKTPTRAELQSTAGSNFSTADSNKDGFLSSAEIDAAAVRAQQQAQQTLAARMSQEFTKLDTDKNGQLSLAEFRAAGPTVRPTPNVGATTVQRLDSNKDGKISLDEYRKPMLATFDRFDTNKNGTLEAAEQAAAQQKR